MAKIVRNWTKWIIPRVNENNQPNGNDGDKSLRTTDTISIRSCEEVQNQNEVDTDPIAIDETEIANTLIKPNEQIVTIGTFKVLLNVMN